MDVRYVNPFIVSIKQVFSTMVGVEVQVLKPTMKVNGSGVVGVSGVIGFSGDAAGACLLCFPTDVACKLASAFAGEEMSESHPDFADAIGELANMIAGGAKSQFDGLAISISLPSVVIGNPHEVTVTGVPSNAPRLIIPCDTELGQFHVEVAMVVGKHTGQHQTNAASAAGAT
ncbi:MAG: chemotaxis protein CheX [Planctomycetes bacterium]|nr:chemotaxis protein CheX [Planctomycetota bacterium]